MEIGLPHLRSFVAVAEERHFGRAAERLHIAQPALSHQIRRLEDELATRLFDRTSRPIRLTAGGAAFLNEARLSLAHAARAVERCQRAAQGELGQLSVGATFWANCAILPAVVRSFRANRPDVSLELGVAPPTDQLDALRKERLDVCFVAFPQWVMGARELELEPILEEPIVAIVPEHHPLGRRQQLSLTDFAKEPFVTLSHAVAPGLMDRQLAMLHERGLAPADVQEVSDPFTMLSLIAGGMGLGLHMASFSRLRPPGVTFIPLVEEVATATLLLAWRRNDDRPLVNAFLGTARQVAQSLEPASLPR